MLENILLGIVTMCTMISYIPQAIKLVKTITIYKLDISNV